MVKTESKFLKRIQQNENYCISLLAMFTRGENMIFGLTMATAVVICVPPEPPISSLTLPRRSVMIDGHIDDIIRLPGSMKFVSDGFTPKMFIMSGEEKSSISSFKMMPVVFDTNLLPNLMDMYYVGKPIV